MVEFRELQEAFENGELSRLFSVTFGVVSVCIPLTVVPESEGSQK